MDNEDIVGDPKFYELSELREVAENLPITSFFEETKDNAAERTFGAWLKTIPLDTLKMLVRTSERFLFPEDFPDRESESHEMDEMDFSFLCVFALGFELNSNIIPREYMQNVFMDIYFLTIAEHFSRLGLTTTTGSTSLLSTENTRITMTPQGKLIADEITKEKK
jgi:hypothetical protein